MAEGPRAFAGEGPPVAQQELGEPMPRPQQIDADVLPAAQQIPHGLLDLGRNVDGRQGIGAIEHCQVARVPAIGFDPIAGPTRDQRGRDEITGNPVSGQLPLQGEPAGPRLVTASHPMLALEALHEAQYRPSDASVCSTGVRCRGSSTAATVVAAC